VLKSQITLTYNEFDFYAKALIEKQGLQIDTALYKAQIKDCEQMYDLKVAQSDAYVYALNQQKKITDNYKTTLANTQEKYDKKLRWNKIYKKAIGILTGVAILEGLIIYLK